MSLVQFHTEMQIQCHVPDWDPDPEPQDLAVQADSLLVLYLYLDPNAVAGLRPSLKSAVQNWGLESRTCTWIVSGL